MKFLKPLAIDLFCGLGGWSEALLAEGYEVVGFDLERHQYGEHRYPAQLVLQNVLTLHGAQFRDAALIVASPPCQFFSYTAMPWTRAKKLAAEVRADPVRLEKELALFKACFRIQREACEAASRHIPLVVENVRGAQPWVGRARWNFGSFYLWGDVPALMPPIAARVTLKAAFSHQPGGISIWEAFRQREGKKNGGGSWFNVAHNTTSGTGQNPDGRKIAGRIVHVRDGADHTRHLTNPGEHGVKHHGSGEVWFDTGPAALSSSSPRRKAASALIAKIPAPLAQHIAWVFHPAHNP